MPNYFKKISCLIFLGVLPFILALNASAQTNDPKKAFERGLTILASTSMTNALHEILKEFSRERNISVSSTFSSTEDLASKIEDGEPANIFITDDEERMKDLQRKGVLNVSSIINIAKDELVVVMPINHYLVEKIENVKGLKNKLNFLMDHSIMVIPDAESDPAGKFINQAFEKLDLKDKSDKKTIKTDSNRRALFMAAHSNKTAIIYHSDTTGRKDIKVIIRIPSDLHDEINYKAAIVADISEGHSISDSEAFVQHLKSKHGSDIFTRFGFKKTTPTSGITP